jgi:hypothetical protein
MKTLLRILFSIFITFTTTSEAVYADPDSTDVIPTIHLVTPNGGEQWLAGSDAFIRWTGTNLNGPFRISYSQDGGLSYTFLTYVYEGTDIGGSTYIGVPLINSQQVKLEISSILYPEVFDGSDKVFSILNTPNIVVGILQNTFGLLYEKTKTIIDSYVYPDYDSYQCNFYFSSDYGTNWNEIASDQTVHHGDGEYLWDIPAIVSDSCLLKIVSISDPAIYGMSSMFSIFPTPSFAIKSTNPEELVHTDSIISIEYEKVDRGIYYNLFFSKDKGTSWTFLKLEELHNSHGYITVGVPSEENDSCLYRVVNAAFPDAGDTSNFISIRNFPSTPVCYVTTDPSTKTNVITWSKPQSEYITDYIVYRETDATDVYEEIGRVNKTNPGEFIDAKCKPDQQAYKYCLSYIDLQNRIYPLKAPHQTMHLSVYKSNVIGYNLIWNPYTGADIESYTIFRGSATDNLVQIAILSGNNLSYTDTDAPSGSVYYRVTASGSSDCSTGGAFLSGSNICSESALGLEEDADSEQFSFYPNPAKDKIYVSFSKPFSIFSYRLSDISGRILQTQTENMNSGAKSEIDVSCIKNGIYFLQLKTDNFTSTQKIIITR